MSLGKTLARAFVFVMLEVAALCGVPMTPKQIEEIMTTLNRTERHHVIKNETGGGKDP